MVRHPYPDHAKGLRGVILSGFFLLGSALSAMAAGAPKYFKTEIPKGITAGNAFSIKIVTYDKDNTAVTDQNLDVKVFISNHEGSTETDLQLINGQGNLVTHVDKAGAYVIQVIDSADETITGTNAFQVRPAIPNATAKGRKS